MKNIKFFNETFPENISELQQPDNSPFIGYAVDGPEPYIRYTVNKITGTLSDDIYEGSITENDLLYSGNKGKLADVTFTRNFQGGMYNTICLPFTLYTLEGTPFEGCTIAEVIDTITNGSQTTLNLTEITVSKETPMRAGYPYFIMPSENLMAPHLFTDVTIEITSQQECTDVTVDNWVIKPHLFAGDIEPTTGQLCILVAENRIANTSAGEMYGTRVYFERF